MTRPADVSTGTVPAMLRRVLPPLLVALPLLHLLFLIAYRNILNHDVAQYISMAQMMLQGQVPFEDIMDTNPPLIIALSVVPKWLSAATGLDIVRSAHLAIVGLIVLVTLLLRSSFTRLLGPEGKYLVVPVLAALTYTGALLLYTNEFGQREHIIAVILLPYVVLRAARAAARSVPWTLEAVGAALATAAVFIKPVYIFIPFLVEGYVFFVRRRSFDRAVPRLPIMMLAAGALLLLWGPMRVFVFEWSGVFTDYYQSYGFWPKKVLFAFIQDPNTHFALIVAVALLALRGRLRTGPGVHLLYTMLLYTAGGVLGLIAQGKGWFYHEIPIMHGVSVLAALLLVVAAGSAHAVGGISRRGMMISTSALLLVQILLYPSITSWPRVGPPEAPGNELSAIILEHTRPDESVASLSAGVGMQFPSITYTGRNYGVRYYSSYPVVMAYSGRDSITPHPERAWIDDRFYREFCEDIRTNAPRLLTVETVTGVWNLPRNLTMEEYLEQKNFFSAEGAAYRFLVEVQGVVSVYIRVDSARVP